MLFCYFKVYITSNKGTNSCDSYDKKNLVYIVMISTTVVHIFSMYQLKTLSSKWVFPCQTTEKTLDVSKNPSNFFDKIIFFKLSLLVISILCFLAKNHRDC